MLTLARVTSSKKYSAGVGAVHGNQHVQVAVLASLVLALVVRHGPPEDEELLVRSPSWA